ncbi:MAG: GcrA family cell cycle regulator [Pseudolabrys sp.]
MTANPGWPDQRVAALKKFAADGLPASHIAVELGVTRNAVIGQIKRRGFEWNYGARGGRARDAVANRFRNERPARVKPLRLPKPYRVVAVPAQNPGPLPEPTPAEIEPLKLSLFDLKNNSCRWPCGDPRAADFYFCGHPTRDDATPYCAHHHRVGTDRRTPPAKPDKPFVYEPKNKTRRWS